MSVDSFTKGVEALKNFFKPSSSASETRPEADHASPHRQQTTDPNPSATVPVKRPPSPTLTTEGKRARTGSKISQEEEAFFPNYTSRPGAVPIAVPQDQWKAASDMKFSGGIRPLNTLNSSPRLNPSTSKSPEVTYGKRKRTQARGFPSHALDFQTVSGDNVPRNGRASLHDFPDEHVPKRQKTANATRRPSATIDSEEEDDEPQSKRPDEWFNRTVEAPVPSMQRISSVVSVHSQDGSQERFSQNEARSVDRILNSQPARARKPKDGPLHVGSKDEPLVLGETPQMPNARLARADQTTAARNRQGVAPQSDLKNAMAKINQPNRSDEEIQNANAVVRNYGNQQAPNAPVRRSPRGPTSTSRNSERQTTPPLRNQFVRDTGSIEKSGTKLRTRMQADSRAPKPAVLDEDEDELNGETTVRSRPGQERIPFKVPERETYESIGRRASAANHPAVNTGARGKFGSAAQNTARKRHGAPPTDEVEYDDMIRSNLFWTKAGRLMGKKNDLVLLYHESAQCFLIQHNDDILLDPYSDKPFALKGASAKSMMYSNGKEKLSVLKGARLPPLTNGEIWLQFPDNNVLDRFIELIDNINPQIKAEPREDEYSRNVFEHATLSFPMTSPDVEIMAMMKRHEQQTSASNGPVQRPMRQLSSDEPSTSPARSTRIEPPATKDKDASGERDADPHSPTSAFRQAAPRRSTRSNLGVSNALDPEPSVQRWTKTHDVPKWDSPLVYPATSTRRTTVDFEDLGCLDDGEFLNDNIISFCIRRLQEQYPAVEDDVHFFSTFFYSKLTTTPNNRKGLNYEAVKRWTKNVDIFSKPFVVVPINQDLHWYVAIICNLNNLSRSLGEEEEEDEETHESPGEEEQANATGAAQSPQPPAQDTPTSDSDGARPPSQRLEDLSLEDAATEGRTLDSSKEGDDKDVLEIPETQEETSPPQSSAAVPDSQEQVEANKPAKQASARKGKRRQGPPPPKYSPDTPIIITLDSLGGTHSTEVRYLKDYVVEEGLDKRGLTISRDEMKGMTAKGIPEQTNFCDCGVYSSGYLREFMKDPKGFVKKVLSRESDQNNDFEDFDPAKERESIRDVLLKSAEEQRVEKVKRRKEKRAARLKAEAEAKGEQAADVPDAPDAGESRKASPAKAISEAANERPREGSLPLTLPFGEEAATSKPSADIEGAEEEMSLGNDEPSGAAAGVPNSFMQESQQHATPKTRRKVPVTPKKTTTVIDSSSPPVRPDSTQ